jgi:hypothetical protein
VSGRGEGRHRGRSEHLVVVLDTRTHTQRRTHAPPAVPNQSSIPKAWTEFDEVGGQGQGFSCLNPSACHNDTLLVALSRRSSGFCDVGAALPGLPFASRCHPGALATCFGCQSFQSFASTLPRCRSRAG